LSGLVEGDAYATRIGGLVGKNLTGKPGDQGGLITNSSADAQVHAYASVALMHKWNSGVRSITISGRRLAAPAAPDLCGAEQIFSNAWYFGTYLNFRLTTFSFC
jgi:hypothetical protein